MTKKHKSSNKFFIFCFLLLGFGICITMADMFSSMIAVGGFNFTSNSINISGFSLYAISVGTAQSQSMANDLSSITKDQGGAGYIYLNDQQYFILASMYENQSDAEKVKDNLKDTKPNTSIVTIKFEPMAFQNSLSDQEKDVISSAFGIFKTTFKKLYDLAVSLDTKITNEVSAKLEVNSIKNEVSKIINNLNTIFANSLSNFQPLKDTLNDLESSLTDLMNNTSTSYAYSTYIKYEYINDMMLYKSLNDNMLTK